MGLSPILIVLVILLVALGAASRLIQLPDSRSSRAPTYPYYGKKALFSAAERSFLGVLEQAVEGRYRVFGKVRLADALGIKAGTSAGERQRALNRITAKHVDFVLCNPHDLTIEALVELDDASHKRGDRRARDDFLEKACATAGVRLVRFAAHERYALSDVRVRLMVLENAPGATMPAQVAGPSMGRPTARR